LSKFKKITLQGSLLLKEFSLQKMHAGIMKEQVDEELFRNVQFQEIVDRI
jgi:hypothetical protein